MLRYRQAVPFCTWRARAAAKRAVVRLLGRALGRMRHLAVAAAVSRWRSTATDARRRRALLERATARMRHSRVAAALSGWAEAVAAARLAQARVGRAIGWWRCRRVAAAWSGWHSRVREQIRLRRLAQRCVTVLRERLLSRSLRRWCHFWLRRAAARRTVVPMTRFGEAKALRCWVQWWHEQIEATGDALLRALLRMQRLHLAAAFSRWRSTTTDARRRRRGRRR